MEQLISFFTDMPDYYKLIWIVCCLSIALIVESITPLFRRGFRSKQHMTTNLVFLSSVVGCNLIIGGLTVGLYSWLKTSEWGLLNLIDLPLWIPHSPLLVFFCRDNLTFWSMDANILSIWVPIGIAHKNSDPELDSEVWNRKPSFPNEEIMVEVTRLWIGS